MQIVIRLGSPAGKSILIDSVGALPREGVRVGWALARNQKILMRT